MTPTRRRIESALRDGGDTGTSDFDLNPGTEPARGPSSGTPPLRDAGVLVALWPGPDGLRLVLTVRSSALRHHPGQIALPGGKVEPVDGGPADAALREAGEEVGLPAASIALLGQLPTHRTVTGFSVTPVVGWVEGPFVPRPEPGEVAEVFTLPFAHAADPGNYRIATRRWRGVDRRYYVLAWGPYYVWGATARILRSLAGRLA